MGLKVLPDILTGLRRSHQKPALLRYKAGGSYRNISTEEFVARVRQAALGLSQAGIERGDRVALLSENRPEWAIADYAILSIGAVNVPIYPTLLPEQVQFILSDCGARAVLCSNPEQAAKIAGVRDRLPALQALLVFSATETLPEGAGTWDDLMTAGGRSGGPSEQKFEKLRAAVQPEDLASIIYTSGTTGIPKGVMLSHGNFTSNVQATVDVMPITEEDVALSFLPLSHVFERMVEYAYLSQGATIAYAESFETVPQNMIEVRPTIISAVPRVFEKFYARVMDTAAGGSTVKRSLFSWALRVGRKRVPYLLEGRSPTGALGLQVSIADKLVFRKVRARVGGQLHYFISGGAPLNADLARFFWSMGLPVYEGYGLTETSPVIAVNRPDKVRLGTVGPVVPGVEVKIEEDGEILVQGPNVMQGYYRNEEANQQVFRDGWFCTGDIGRIDEDGFLVITDRKKDVIKTSGGKMIAPQPMENALKANKFITNAVVLGERRNFISALLVPNFERLDQFCRARGLGSSSMEERLTHPKVLELYRAQVDRAMAGRARYEQVKEFRLLPRDFTLEDGEITPTLKVKRNVVEKKYQDLILSMYPDC